MVLPTGIAPAKLTIAAGKIVGVDPWPSESGDIEVHDCGDAIIGPGGVDAHVHVNEPGRTEWEGFATATAAAAAGGVTTLIDMPLNSSPVTTTAERLDAKRSAAAGKAWVDVAFYGGLIAGGAGSVADLIQAGVAGIKAFLCDSGLDEFPPATETDLLAAGERLAEAGVPLLVHAELPLQPAPTLTDARRYAEYLASRPEAWELDAIDMLVRVARETGCSVHVVHLANSEALAIVEAAREQGLSITVETCPHYLHFAAESISDGDTLLKCAPPIREGVHRQELWEALKAGQIDTIGSDHSPCPPEMKRQEEGDFLKAWGGIAGLQLSLPVVWTGAQQHGASIHRVFDWLSEHPAERFGLGEQKGRLADGFDADLVVFDPDANWKVDSTQLHHRHKLSPYHGEQLTGRVLETWVRGRQVFAEGQLIGDPAGELLAPSFLPS